jgi:hypothetical protein
MAHYEDLQIDQGTDVVVKLECYNSDGTKKLLNYYDSDEQTIMPFYIVRGKIKKTYNSKDSDSLDFNTTTISAGIEGHIIELSLTNLQTDTMKPGRYVYDVELESYDSDTDATIVERILEGKLTVTPSVTRLGR